VSQSTLDAFAKVGPDGTFLIKKQSIAEVESKIKYDQMLIDQCVDPTFGVKL